MTHAFYADMGGFLLEGPGVETPFPVDAKQLLFLVEQGYVEYPEITRDDIDDRNKSDGFARWVLIMILMEVNALLLMTMIRFIAVCQAVWLLLNCILRGAQGLALTTLELTTISFVIVFFATSFCWYYKPQDITSTTTVTLAVDISTIQKKVNHASSTGGNALTMRKSTALQSSKNGTQTPWNSCIPTSTSATSFGATSTRFFAGFTVPSSLVPSPPNLTTASQAMISRI